MKKGRHPAFQVHLVYESAFSEDEFGKIGVDGAGWSLWIGT